MKKKSFALIVLVILLLMTSCSEKERPMYDFSSADKSDQKFYGMTDDEVLYSIQDDIFCMKSITYKWEEGVAVRWGYREYDEVYEKMLYIHLYYYNKTTKSDLTLEDIKDFLSEEYEDDGSLRLFSNGKHTEIREYINWHRFENFYENRRAEGRFCNRVKNVARQTTYNDLELRNTLAYLPEYGEIVDEYVYLEQFTFEAIDAFIEASENNADEADISADKLIDTNAVLYK